jgi:predicted Zn-dependent peptidase
MTIKTFSFPNGFRVIYEKSPNIAPIACIKIMCDIGSVYENNETRGVSHFIEHMCFKGTKNIPIPKDIFMEYDKIGAYLNATTGKRYTYYTIKCNNEYVENSIRIMSDMLLNSTFNKNEYKKEEKVVIEENIKDINDVTNTAKTSSNSNLPTPSVGQTSSVATGKAGNDTDESAQIRNFRDLLTNRSDMVEIKMNILGDPYYLPSSGFGNQIKKPTKKIRQTLME